MVRSGVFRLVLLLACAAGAAQAQTTPLREDQVTEAAVAAALSASAVPDGVRTRGFRPGVPPGGRREAPLLITFAADSAELLPGARKALDVVAKVLRSDQLAASRFSIEGHADPRGGQEHNLTLSQRRAESVVAYLVREHGIAPERLQPVGKGASELVNKADQLAPENRRVTIVVR